MGNAGQWDRERRSGVAMSDRTTLDRDDQNGKRRFHRRGMLRLAAVGAGASALSSLLAACGGDAPTATTAPVATSARPSTAASSAPASAAASTGGASAAP